MFCFDILAKHENWKIATPVGLYNLGNTCFMNCVLQCLLHCIPLQKYFLQRVGHHHVSCELLRAGASPGINKGSFGDSNVGQHCIACEMDRLFLETYGSVCGIDALKAVSDDGPNFSTFQKPTPCSSGDGSEITMVPETKLSVMDPMTRSEKMGWPLIPSRLLTASWKCGSMDHLAGYEQRDAHEFLQAFLDTMGKHATKCHARVTTLSRQGSEAKEVARPANEVSYDISDASGNITKRVFEGRLRSVLICETCGCKRSQPEPFINVSLPIFKERDRSNQTLPVSSSDQNTLPPGPIGTRTRSGKISLQMCLEQFTTPERLADPVHCHWCNSKTATQKQHTFAKLPKVLCLHLKRFDARTNKKINDPVTFPINGLDLGPHLPHWCVLISFMYPLLCLIVEYISVAQLATLNFFYLPP